MPVLDVARAKPGAQRRRGERPGGGANQQSGRAGVETGVLGERADHAAVPWVALRATSTENDADRDHAGRVPSRSGEAFRPVRIESRSR